jgi:hypothetical protein
MNVLGSTQLRDSGAGTHSPKIDGKCKRQGLRLIPTAIAARSSDQFNVICGPKRHRLRGNECESRAPGARTQIAKIATMNCAA